MARYPDAAWHRCPGSEPSIRPTQLIYHTAVVRDLTVLRNYFCSGRSGGIESHFGVGGIWGTSPAQDGAVEQWRDTEEQADANLHANRRPDGTGAISVETCDNAPRSPELIAPWTPKQLAALINLGQWAHETHGIPLRVCRNPDDPGFGWHAMWGAPSAWTPAAGKVCPGPARISQLKQIVFPAIFAGHNVEDDMFSDDDRKKLDALYDVMRDTADGEPIDHESKLYRLTTWGSEAKGEGRPNLEDITARLERLEELVSPPPPPPAVP